MSKKDNSSTHIILISLLISSVINYYISYKYKSSMLSSIGDQFYYQIITWLSLAQPVFVGIIYKRVRRRYYLIKRWLFMRKEIDVSKLTPKQRKMYDSICAPETMDAPLLEDLHRELSNIED